ncbi:MAG: L-aspartate oxidase [Candidatus Coatesbacteria bacterium]|nr:L-aspartate oxidase [Candidatus Coatesbacteria bacterium]
MPLNLEFHKTDFLVIGSGVAGLRAAIALSDAGKVMVLAKSAVSEGSTECAQGGVAVAMSDDDEIVIHEQDTLRAGASLCNPEAVRILVNEGPRRIAELIEWGASFDTEDGKLWFSLEGAHSRRRVIHSRGDSTGAEIERVLLEKAEALENVSIVDHWFTIDLLIQEGSCSGALVVARSDPSRIVCIQAKATVLATGGAGQVYAATTNPSVSTGDGISIAFRAGAEISDMEFVQFHPTTLHKEGVPVFLLSEAMRGEGGVLLNAMGERFMPDAHPEAELAPRDIVSRAIITEMRRTGTDEIYLDLRHFKPGFVKSRFPRIYETCLGYGLKADEELLPIHPAAHYMMGGVRSDVNGRTTIPGLLACGEVACAGVHGANRLASNSLLEGVVFGRRAGESARDSISVPAAFSEAPARDFLKELESVVEVHSSEILLGRERIRGIMWEHVGIVRDPEGLQIARRELEKLSHIAGVVSADPKALEARNIFYTAALIRYAAERRTESRGAHFRADFPKQDDENWLVHKSLSSETSLQEILS